MITYTKLLALLLLIGGGALGVRNTPPSDTQDLRCFVFTVKFPMYDARGNSIPNDLFNNTHRVFIYHDLAMYELSYGFDSGRVNDGPPIVSETRYKYFVFHKDSASGIVYELRYRDRFIRGNVDSMSKQLGGLTDTGKTRSIFNGQFPLLYSKWNDGGGTRLEAYKIPDLKHPEDRDTLWLLYSDRFGLLPRNLCHIRDGDDDSLSPMKLAQVRVQVHFHDVPPAPGYSYELPYHGEFLWKVEETPFFNRDSAAMYFAKYQTYLDSGGLAGAGQKPQ